MTTSAALDRLKADLGDLLARHEHARDLTDFRRYADDPLGFLAEVLGWKPYPKQALVAEAVRDRPLVTVQGANGTGKDAIAARIALWACYARGALVMLCGPTSAQVEEILMRKEIARAFRSASDLPGELHVRALRPGGDTSEAGILARTSTAVSALTGHHEADVLFVVTEAQGCEEYVLEAAFACTMGKRDRVLLLGNPLVSSGFFYRCARDPAWHSIKIPADETPNVQAGRVVVPGLVTREGIERIISQYGPDSPFVEARVRAEFPSRTEHGLFDRRWLEAAFERWRDNAATTGGQIVAALDVARYGPDHSCLALRRGPVVEPLVTWSGHDLVQTVERAERELADRGLGQEAVTLVVDVVGLGAGAADGLKERGWRVREFNGGRRARDPDRFANVRSESYWLLGRRLEVGELAIPPDEQLVEELLATTWSPTPEGKIQLPPKEVVKAEVGRSPDRADALAMLVWFERQEVPAIGPVGFLKPWGESVARITETR